jgi:hypothetical protein
MIKQYLAAALCVLLIFTTISCGKNDRNAIESNSHPNFTENVSLNNTKVFDYLDNFTTMAGVMIYGLTTDVHGNIYYTTSLNEIRKIDKNGIDSVFFDNRIHFSLLEYFDDTLVSLIYEGGYNKLVEIDNKGQEITVHTPEFETSEGFISMTRLPGTRKICLTHGGGRTRGSILGYIYNLDSQELITLKNSNYDNVLEMLPLASGEMLLLRTDASPLEINLGSTEITYDNWWDSNEYIYTLIYDKTIGTYYTYKPKSENSGRIYYIDRSTEKLIYLCESDSLSIISFRTAAACNGVLYYLDDSNFYTTNISYIDTQILIKKMEYSPVTLYIAYNSDIDASVNLMTYVDEYKKNNPSVHIEFVEYMHDWESNLQVEQQMALDILSGKTKIDLLIFNINDKQYLKDIGILKDLNEFEDMKKVIDNQNLITGFKNLCVTKHDNGFFGIPFIIDFNFYLMEKELFYKYDIPFFNMGDSYEDAIKKGKKYCRDYDGNGIIDVYLFWEHRPNKGVFNFNPAYGINAQNNFVPLFDSPSFIQYISDSETPSYYNFNLTYTVSEEYFHTYSRLMDYPILLRDVSLMDYFPSSNEKDKFLLWAYNNKIKDLFDGTSIKGSFIGISESSDNPEESVRFLLGFFNEEYQRVFGSFPVYKDVSKYNKYLYYPDNFEDCVSFIYQNYVECSIIPRFWFWINDKVYEEYFSLGLTSEQLGSILQKEALKKIKG